jgi:hypothetical protein
VRTPDRIEGSIVAHYELSRDGEPEAHMMDHDGTLLGVTTVHVTTWWDGEISVEVWGRPLKYDRTIHRGRSERAIYLDEEAARELCSALDIATTQFVTVP